MVITQKGLYMNIFEWPYLLVNSREFWLAITKLSKSPFKKSDAMLYTVGAWSKENTA